MVYPGAVHSRFEHSLGVYWLAGESVEKLKNYQVHCFLPFIFHPYEGTIKYLEGFSSVPVILAGNGAWY